LPKSNNPFYKELETLLFDNVDRVFKGKAEKALPKGNDLFYKELETLLFNDVDRVFKGKAKKALPKSNNPSREDR
jgi:hypothetical protein